MTGSNEKPGKTREELMQDEKYYKEYMKCMRIWVEMAIEHPDLIDEMRRNIKLSASLMYSNRPETVSAFRELSEEIDSVLEACQTGEIDIQKWLNQNE